MGRRICSAKGVLVQERKRRPFALFVVRETRFSKPAEQAIPLY